MRLLDRQIVRELIGPFLFGVTAFSSVFFAGTYLLNLTRWLMDGMPILIVAQLVLLYLPPIIVYTLPMSTLLAVLLGMTRLSGDSEVVALFAGGVSLYRIALPITIFGALVSMFTLVLTEYVAPWSSARNNYLQAVVLKKTLPTDQPFSIYDNGTNSQIRVAGGVDPVTGDLRRVTIVQFVGDKPSMMLYGKRAQWSGLTDKKKPYEWKLYDGFVQVLGNEHGTASESREAILEFHETNAHPFEMQKKPEDILISQKITDLRNADQLSFRQLITLVSELKRNPDRKPEEVRQVEVAKWNKLAVPLSSLIFAMLAAPMGIRRQRSSSSVGLGLSVFLIFMYWMVWNYSTSLAIAGNIDPIIGAFMADVLGVAAAILLLRRAAK